MTRFASLKCFVCCVSLSIGATAAFASLPRPGKAEDLLQTFDAMYITVEDQPAAPATPPAATDTKPIAPPPADDGTTAAPDDGTAPSDEPSLGEVEVPKIADLTLDSAQRAVDAYVLLKEKYKDAQLENYESLQDFVDKDPQGKAFEADVKAAGFPNVDEWNVVITTVSSAYGNITNDQSADITQQIEEVQKDPELAQDMKDKLTNSLKALIPTENNRKVVQALIDNPANTEKLKLLETEDE
jgi:phosphoribosylformylglycinamidine (FGAM) synthase PurS component